MSKRLRPVIGEWYQSSAGTDYFRIVAIDDTDGAVEVQYIDGEIDEFDRESWLQLDLAPASAPEDASAPFEADNFNDTENTDSDTPSNDADYWRNHLDIIDPGSNQDAYFEADPFDDA